MNRPAISVLLLLYLTCLTVAGQQKPAKPQTETKGVRIARALSAAPASIAKSAKVVDKYADGKEIVLREGTNGFTCFPGHPGVIGDAAFCANAPALQWEDDMAQHNPKPTNTEPGIEYMLAGATDWSASDPHATSAPRSRKPLIG